MSYPHSELHYFHHLSNPKGLDGLPRETPRSADPIDLAIDSALRGVPLPEGLITRLDKLALAMVDETTDSVDCLGC